MRVQNLAKRVISSGMKHKKAVVIPLNYLPMRGMHKGAASEGYMPSKESYNILNYKM